MRYFGGQSGLLTTVAMVATLVGGAAMAQSLRDAGGPAEFPPTSFTANQYVDSRGCVFVRAGIGGTTNWVPRVSRNREQLCGFQPTQVAGATTTQPTPDVPNPLDTQVAGLPDPTPAPTTTPEARPEPVAAATPAPAPAPTPTVRAPAPVVAAAPAPRIELPTDTSAAVNPLTGQRVGTAAPAAATPTPQVITAPAATPAPRTITLAEACDGRTGVQPNMISQRTGQPIDCGGATAPQVAAVTAPVEPTPAVTQPRLSRAQACADMEASGRQYVSATTGLPIRCGLQNRPATGNWFDRLRADLARPQQTYTNPLDISPGSNLAPTRTVAGIARNQVPYSNPLDAAPGSTFTPGANTRLATSCTYGEVSGSNGLPVRCGPQAQSPSGGADTVAVTRARTNLGILGIQDPPPYSNPSRSYALPAPVVPDGYERVWSDGRLNTQRGLPRGAVQVRNPSAMALRAGPQGQSPSGYSNTVRYATQPTLQAIETTTRAVAPRAPAQQQAEQISGHRYVQVGTFGSRDEAQAIARTLRSRGLPMRIGVFDQNGQQMRIVLAGPFGSDTQLQSALGTARGAGFSGAFTRR